VFFKLSNVLPESQSTELIANNIRKRYAKKGEEVVNMNIQAMEQAGKELVSIDYPASWINCKMEPLHVFPPNASEAYKNLQYHIAMISSDQLPVSAFIPGGRQETDTAQYEKRGMAAAVPVWNKDTCTQCNQCASICPHSVIRPFLATADELKSAPATFQTLPAAGDELKGLNFRIQLSPLDCTGCEVCTNVCPTQSLTMKPLSEVSAVESKNWEYAMTLTNKGDLVDKTTVKGLAFQEPMLEFNGACAGCGEMTIVKMMTQLFGDRIQFADAMGCTMVSLGGTGVVP
jgi:pyruvate-ferredoxin/flavodoxin oxidoreductase